MPHSGSVQAFDRLSKAWRMVSRDPRPAHAHTQPPWVVTGTIVVVADVPDVCGGAARCLRPQNSVALGEVVVRVAVIEAGGLPVRVVVLDRAGRAAEVLRKSASARSTKRWSGVVRSIMT